MGSFCRTIPSILPSPLLSFPPSSCPSLPSSPSHLATPRLPAPLAMSFKYNYTTFSLNQASFFHNTTSPHPRYLLKLLSILFWCSLTLTFFFLHELGVQFKNSTPKQHVEKTVHRKLDLSTSAHSKKVIGLQDYWLLTFEKVKVASC